MKICGFEVHQVAQIFPLIEGPAFEDMAVDVELRGVLEPAWVHKGELIDGRNRGRCVEWAEQRRIDRAERAAEAHRAAIRAERAEMPKAKSDLKAAIAALGHQQRAGAAKPIEAAKKKVAEAEAKVQALAQAVHDTKAEAEDRAADPPHVLPTREWDGKGSLVAFVLSRNLHRRHLSESQRAMIAGRAAAGLEMEARGRQLAGLKQGAAAPFRPVGRNGKPPAKDGESREQAAKLANVSGRSVGRAQAVIKQGVPQLAAAVDAGKISVSKAAEFARKAPEEQLRLIKEEGERAERQVREHDYRDSLARWTKQAEKLLRQFVACDPPVRGLVAWARKGLKLLAEESGRAGSPPERPRAA